MQAAIENSALTSQELLAFQVGGQAYAVDIASVREIRGWTAPSSMPDAEAHKLGVINLRGEVLQLFDLASALGLQAPEINERSVIIVVESQDNAVGLLVDSVSNIIHPTTSDLKDPPEAANGSAVHYVSALTLVDEEIVRILDLAAILPNEKFEIHEI